MFFVVKRVSVKVVFLADEDGLTPSLKIANSALV